MRDVEPSDPRLLADFARALEATGAALAPAHADALRLAATGACSADIARALEIPVEAVAPLLEVAGAKLGRLVARRSAPRDVEPRGAGDGGRR